MTHSTVARPNAAEARTAGPAEARPAVRRLRGPIAAATLLFGAAAMVSGAAPASASPSEPIEAQNVVATAREHARSAEAAVSTEPTLADASTLVFSYGLIIDGNMAVSVPVAYSCPAGATAKVTLTITAFATGYGEKDVACKGSIAVDEVIVTSTNGNQFQNYRVYTVGTIDGGPNAMRFISLSH